MAAVVEAPDTLSPVADLDFDIDVDHLLQSFSSEELLELSADFWAPDFPSPPPPSTTTDVEKYDSPSGESGCSSGSVSSYVCDLEKFLLEEEVEDDEAVKEGFDADDFFACLFAEKGSSDGKREGATPDSDAAVESERKEAEAPAQVEVDRQEQDDDPVSKKLRRQIRNRDSAMKSRERKKVYVKELEMKSKYLEAECRRLDYALRCCAAENLALRQCLQKESPFDASTAKQESAVLFVGKIDTHIDACCLLFLLHSAPVVGHLLRLVLELSYLSTLTIYGNSCVHLTRSFFCYLSIWMMHICYRCYHMISDYLWLCCKITRHIDNIFLIAKYLCLHSQSSSLLLIF
ncbi:hypothetical protein Cni_G04018 [Canna indica]|uniref:BZIP domain-containing protein n=1 Tax=Canna indica TaxID=4628 RepID=A0AAQ3JSW0_9LILI|nr:hypothetical protein Cni_G04018 [Canna indica]